jgi:hypothetical protein
MTRRNRNTVSAARRTSARRVVVRQPGTRFSEELEQRRLLTASIGVSTGLMVFDAVSGSASPTETLTLTDVGADPLTLGPSAFSIAGGSAAQFTILNASSAPATLASGASFGLQIQYTASVVGRQVAAVYIASNDPVNGNLAVGLSGIGAAGIGGTSQPSLTRILRAYGIPTDVGEDESATLYPNPPGATSQEVSLQRLMKAGAGPVTIQVLASFTAAAAEPYTLGYYTAGSPSSKTELFYTKSSDYQSVTVQPQGTTTFDPGASYFGMYFVSNILDNGVNRVGYSEDTLNTFDTTNSRKFRFFPMENPDGSRVPNAYIMTSTEYQSPNGYDFTNIVAIIRNVTAAPSAPTAPSLQVTDNGQAPGSSNVLFSAIATQNSTLGDTVHNVNTFTLQNNGGTALTVTSLTLSNPTYYSISGSPTLPFTLAPGASAVVGVKLAIGPVPSTPYNETDGTVQGGGGVAYGTLAIGSSDPVTPSKVINLAGWVQSQSEHGNEPALQTLVNLMAGYGTLINPTPITYLLQGTTATYYGEETVSQYWAAADPNRQVNVTTLAAYHTQGQNSYLQYYPQGSGTYTTIVSQDTDSAQTVFPGSLSGTTSPGYFSTSSAFGFRVGGTGGVENSVDSSNPTNTGTGGAGHDIRFFAARDSVGNLIPNTYLACVDYQNENSDFQDLVYVISNIRPAGGSTAATGSGIAPAAPTDLSATNTAAGVALQWAPSLTAGVTGYVVLKQNGDGSYTQVNGSLITGTSYVDTAANTAVGNSYRISAVATIGGVTRTSVGTSVTTTFAVPTAAQGYTASISGTTWDDSNADGKITTGEVGVGGFSVFIDVNGNGVYDAGVDPIAVSGTGGAWSITGLAPGTYTVIQIAPPGWNRTFPTGSNSQKVTVDTAQRATNVNFGASQLGTIAGTIFYDLGFTGTLVAGDPGLAGFTMFVDNNANGVFDPGIDSRFAANSNGVYSIYGFAPGTYYIGVDVPAGWAKSTPATLPVAIKVTENGTAGVNFGFTRATISGTVFNDANHNGTQDSGEAGLANQTVFLDFFGTGVYQSGDIAVTTNSAGTFTIAGLAPGTYKVNMANPSGYRRTIPVATGYSITVTAGQRKTGATFGFTSTTNASEVAGSAVPATPAASPFSTAATPLYDSVDALIG